ncbi:MAG: hypothetical protein HQL32_06545 [Planctomycetes bacterium]|nr:hypothetical protein [Planctomycetota bacterium]
MLHIFKNSIQLILLVALIGCGSKSTKKENTQYPQFECKVGFSHDNPIDWSGNFMLSDKPHEEKFTNGHKFKAWLSGNIFFHIWETTSGNISGEMSPFPKVGHKTPVAIIQNLSELAPSSSGTIWIQAVPQSSKLP